jgi:hypothetical protein
MNTTTTNSYTPPVSQLLTYGEGQATSSKNWPNYLELGLGPEHIPDLIRMATDEDLNTADPESLEVWAPLHAWRTLGQLRAVEAVNPLLSLFESPDMGDWELTELPDVFAMIGPAALPIIAAFIADTSKDEYARDYSSEGINQIASKFPEARPDCIELLIKQLEKFTANGRDLNASIIYGLAKLKATEAAPLIERAFAANLVDLFLMGDWDDVQVELGLLSAEELEQRRRAKILPETPFRSHKITPPQPSAREKHQHEAAHQKTKSKMAKQSRKKNRKH